MHFARHWRMTRLITPSLAPSALSQAELAAVRDFEADLHEWTSADAKLTAYEVPPSSAPNDDTRPAGRRYGDCKTFTGPLSFFELFFDTAMVDSIVQNTNANIAQRKASGIALKAADVTAADIRALFGTLLLMSTARMDDIDDYWHEEYGWAPVNSRWSRDRFHAVFHSLSVNSAPPPPDNTDRMWNVKPFVDELNKRFAAALVPGRTLCVDETMIACRADHPSIQYLPKKPTSIGFKCFTISNSFGYVLCQILYEGKTGDDSKDDGLTERVVLQLVAPYGSDDGLGPWRIVTMDSFYTAAPLFKKLHAAGTLAVGTLRSDRRFFPKELNDVELGTYVARHDHISAHTRHCTASSLRRDCVATASRERRHCTATSLRRCN
jgi:hypothetical protein